VAGDRVESALIFSNKTDAQRSEKQEQQYPDATATVHHSLS